MGLIDFLKAMHDSCELSPGEETSYTASDGEVYMIKRGMNGHEYRQRTSTFPQIVYCSSTCDCRKIIEEGIKQRRENEAQANRIVSRRQELISKFEQSGRKQNFASTEEIDALLNLTEKKIIQQCRRSECHGCKVGWICPKYWSK